MPREGWLKCGDSCDDEDGDDNVNDDNNNNK